MTPRRKGASERVQDAVRSTAEVSEQFCKSTSFHGLKFVVVPESHWLERVFWILVFLAGLGFSSYFCWQMWVKYDASPLLMSLETTRFPLKNIPFPAVTICNVNKAHKKRLDAALTDPRYQNITYEMAQQTLRFMTKLDRAIDNGERLKELSEFYASQNISSLDLFHLLKLTAPNCNDMVLDCIWQGLPAPCNDYLSFLPSDDGLCCVFNGAIYNDTELGLHSSPDPPLIVSGNGYRMGLSLVLDAQLNEYSVTNGKFDGFKVLVHASQKFPDISDRGFVLGPGTETFAGVKATSSYTADEVAEFIPKWKRKCRADEDGGLLYFPRYSQSGCITECATKSMTDLCGCRPFFLRAPEGTPLCNMSMYQCLDLEYEKIRMDVDKYCDCPPPCTDEWYEPEISYATFPGNGFNLSRTHKRLKQKLGADGVNDIYFESNVAVLHVYYKDRTGIRYRTDIRFGIEDFLTAMGGLLSLGLGMSFISIVEIFYFMFMRGFCYLRFSSESSQNVDLSRRNTAIPLSFTNRGISPSNSNA